MKLLLLLPCAALSGAAFFSPQAMAPLRLAVPGVAAPDSTTVRVVYGADEPELNEVLSHVLEVEKHRLTIHDPRLAGHLFHITYQEFRQGKAEPEKELVAQPARLLTFDATGTFACAIYARQKSDTQVENRFLFTGGRTTKTFPADPKRADQYSFRTDIHPKRRAADQTGRRANSPVEELRLPVGRKLPLAVYTLPYESEGMLLYCNLAQSRVPVTEWYSRFHIPHFVVYYVQITAP